MLIYPDLLPCNAPRFDKATSSVDERHARRRSQLRSAAENSRRSRNIKGRTTVILVPDAADGEPAPVRRDVMRSVFRSGRSLVLLTAVVLSLSGCLGDNCRPNRGWDSGHHRGGDHHCDRDRDRHHHD
jgi:hypothetical protein